jgi:hypothetical protein
MIDQLPILPAYRTKTGDYLTLREAVKSLPQVTPNVEHNLIRRPANPENYPLYHERAEQIRAGTFSRSTLFNEIEVVMRPSGTEDLFGRRFGEEEISSGEMAALAVAGFRDFLRESWRPEAKHVMMFSSGYDTRLIGALIKQLADENGDDWLGDTKFCCFQPEIEDAKSIYDYIGLPQRCWFPIDEGAPASDYYTECLDFKTIGAQLSDSERVWAGPLLTQLRLGDWLDDDVQGVSAVLSDETSTWNRLQWNNIAWFLGCYLFDNPGVLPGRPDVNFLFPFISREWIRLVSTYKIPISIDDFKKAMIEQVDPVLATLPNFRFKIKAIRDATGGHAYQQEISAATAQRMEDDYRASWYASEVGPATLDYQDDRIFRYFSDRNVHYIKAAIYQHLIDLS